MPTHTSGMHRYHIKWTQLADLPAPLYGACVAVQDKKYIIVSLVVIVELKMLYIKCMSMMSVTNWGQLPPSFHYYGIPHIIGGKLVIIGGHLSTTKKRTNKVSTFDEDSQTWTSYYPDMLNLG